jgi:dephospho-CoA kinase
MGKSTIAGMFVARGVPVHDADRAVHVLYTQEAAAEIEAAFPGTRGDQGIDRQKLAAAVIGQADAMARLESLIHPRVKARQLAFLEAARRGGAFCAVLDIPLLFEGGRESLCDLILVVSAPAAIQRERVMARPGMTAERFTAILARQMPDAEKRRRAHWVIENGGTLAETEDAISAFLKALPH